MKQSTSYILMECTSWIVMARSRRWLQACKSVPGEMTAEFGRAVQVGHKLRVSQRSVRMAEKTSGLFALAAIASLPSSPCVDQRIISVIYPASFVYWAVLVVIILVTLAVAGRQYIREMVNGRPVAQSGEGPVDLEGRWWECLAPEEPTVAEARRTSRQGFPGSACPFPPGYLPGLCAIRWLRSAGP